MNGFLETFDSATIWCPFSGFCIAAFHVFQCFKSRTMVYHPVYLQYLSVNDTDKRVQVILVVERYTPLALSVIPQLGATRCILMYDPWSADVRPRSSHWWNLELSPEFLHNKAAMSGAEESAPTMKFAAEAVMSEVAAWTKETEMTPSPSPCYQGWSCCGTSKVKTVKTEAIVKLYCSSTMSASAGKGT